MYNFQQCVIFIIIIIIILFLHPPWVWCCFFFPLTPLEGKYGQALTQPPTFNPPKLLRPYTMSYTIWFLLPEKKPSLGRNQLEMVPVTLLEWRAPCSHSLLLGGWHGVAGGKVKAEVLGGFGAL